jgi:hypothetical protein
MPRNVSSHLVPCFHSTVSDVLLLTLQKVLKHEIYIHHPPDNKARLEIFTHSAARRGVITVGFVARVQYTTVHRWHQAVGSEERMNVYYGQLGAIYEAARNPGRAAVVGRSRPHGRQCGGSVSSEPRTRAKQSRSTPSVGRYSTQIHPVE